MKKMLVVASVLAAVCKNRNVLGIFCIAVSLIICFASSNHQV